MEISIPPTCFGPPFSLPLSDITIFRASVEVRKVYLRSTVTRRRIDTCGKAISFRNNQFGSNKRLIVAISSCIENKRVSFNAMLLGITRLQPELSADHSETFHLCYCIFRWIIANFTRWNTKLGEYFDREWICRFFFLFFFYSSLSSSLHCFPSRLVQRSFRLPSAFSILALVEITFSTPFPPSIRKLICRNAEETLVCLLFNPFERRNVTNERTGIKGFSTSILIAPAREEEDGKSFLLRLRISSGISSHESLSLSLSTRRQTVAAAVAASYYRYSIARRIKRRSSEWHETWQLVSRSGTECYLRIEMPSKRIRR